MKKRQFRIVMSFEFMNFMRNKVYIGITIFIVVLLALGLSAPTLVETAKNMGIGNGTPDPDDPSRTIYILDRTADPQLYSYLLAALPDERFAEANPAELETIRQKINDNQARAALIIESASQLTFIERRSGSNALPAQLESVAGSYYRTRNLSEAGFNPQEIESLLTPPQMNLVELVEEEGKSMTQTYFYTYLLLFLLYMTVMMYGQLVASSVASEKSNRAMEMLITSARPMSLMFGKVIGSGLAGLAQIGVFLAAAAAFYSLNQDSWSDIPFIRSIFEMPPQIIFFTVFFYLTGYFMFAFLYGALGSLASRTEDINTSIMPIMLLVMAAMFVSIFGMINPEAGWLAVFSFIPFFSPMAMFVRISMTNVPAYEIAVSCLVMLLTIYATGWISSRIYRIGVLMYGKPPRLGELLRILRQDRN